MFDGTCLRSGVALDLSGGAVRIVPPASGHRRITGTVSPGLVDLQVNGGGGVLLNTSPTPAGIAAILAAHRRFGTTRLLPTVITDAPEVIEAAADAVGRAWGLAGLLGLHIEGPHISPARRGTHDARFIRPLDDHTMALVERLRRRGIPVMLTVAPEMAQPSQIERLARTGAIVSLGHSDATAAEAGAALAAGARNVTHLFNAMSQMTGREPGLAGAAILSDADMGMICDGIHVSDAMLRLALTVHGTGRSHIVSDAMPTVGGPDEFQLYGKTIRVSAGRLVNDEGNLAGAHTTMAEGVARLCSAIGLSFEDALRMAITNPARLIGAPAGIEECPAADLLLWQDGAPPRFLLA